MYRCTHCPAVSRPGEPLRRHVVYRATDTGRQEISHEFPVCADCAFDLAHGLRPGSTSAARNRPREPGVIPLPLPRPVVPAPLTAPTAQSVFATQPPKALSPLQLPTGYVPLTSHLPKNRNNARKESKTCRKSEQSQSLKKPRHNNRKPKGR